MGPFDGQKEKMPLVHALTEQAGRVSFHMPGHRQGRFQFPLHKLSAFDVTELDGTGDLAEPSGHVLAAYRQAAEFFGAGETWFITAGTTASIFIMMATALQEGDRVILPRAVHLAAVHAAGILGLAPVFVKPEEGQIFPDGQPSASDFLRTMEENPRARAVFVTSPDYFGRTLDLEPIARMARELGMLLLVDEAHGAHFVAAPGQLPPTALFQGADLVCQSAHKTLPALTPASFLHLSRGALEEKRLDSGRAARFVKVFQTSSPSFLIAASMDAARARAQAHGEAAIGRLIFKNQELSRRLPPSFRRLLPAGADASRLVLDFSGLGRDRLYFLKMLDRAGIDPEMADLSRAVFIPGFDQPDGDYDRLLEALLTMEPVQHETERQAHLDRVNLLSREQDRLLSRPAAFSVSVRRGMFGPAGKTVPTALAPYPPGMPLVWPGEVADTETLTFLQQLREAGITVRGSL